MLLQVAETNTKITLHKYFASYERKLNSIKPSEEFLIITTILKEAMAITSNQWNCNKGMQFITHINE